MRMGTTVAVGILLLVILFASAMLFVKRDAARMQAQLVKGA